MTTASEVIAGRRREQQALLDRARQFSAELPSELDVRVVVVFGSVARGDFHDASDVDVLVIAQDLPVRAPERNARLGIPPPRVEFVAWTPDDWERERRRGNPICTDAERYGVVIRGALPCG